MSEHQPIRIASAIITNDAGQCLLVRKRGTEYFIQPGGKIEATELPLNALIRELEEELSFQLEHTDFTYVGRFTDEAVNEPGRIVMAEIFHYSTGKSEFNPAAEIEEVLWYSPGSSAAVLLAPLTANQLMPLVSSLHLNQKGI